VLITHDAALAARCDRVIEMKDGHIIRDERRIEMAARAAE
jgi:putative ABC transport system ATP-binding protein